MAITINGTSSMHHPSRQTIIQVTGNESLGNKWLRWAQQLWETPISMGIDRMAPPNLMVSYGSCLPSFPPWKLTHIVSKFYKYVSLPISLPFKKRDNYVLTKNGGVLYITPSVSTPCDIWWINPYPIYQVCLTKWDKLPNINIHNDICKLYLDYIILFLDYNILHIYTYIFKKQKDTTPFDVVMPSPSLA